MDLNFLIDIQKKINDLHNMLDQNQFKGQQGVIIGYNCFAMLMELQTNLNDKIEEEKLNSEGKK